MRLAAQLGLSFARLLDSVSPSVIVFGHEAFTIERTLVQVARHKDIPTIGFVHGGLQPLWGRLGNVGDADYVMAWNKKILRS